MHAFEELTIERLSYTVMLRRVVSSKLPLSTFILKKVGEIMASKLTAAIRPKMFDVRAMLSLRPGCERLAKVSSLVLRTSSISVLTGCLTHLGPAGASWG